MIKKICALSIMLISSFSFAQNTFPPTGKTGIGTTTPSSILEILPTAGQIGSSLLIKDGSGAARLSFTTDNGAVGGSNGYGGLFLNNRNGASLLSVYDTGAVGSYMVLNSNFILGANISIPGTNYYGMYVNSTSRFTQNSFFDSKVLLTGAPPANSGASFPVPVFPTTAGGINVANYKLFVKGGILTEEIRVSLATTWADYVFNKDYKLPTLQAVEKQIQDKGHLFNVPSAKEVATDGINLGEMSKIQQEKIEELTLYIIQQNKTNEAQNIALKKQNKEIEDLKILVNALAKKRK
jgi:hypothetical protein